MRGMAKVIPLTKKQRHKVTLLSEAMSEAIEVLGGEATVAEVIDFVSERYAFRQWSPASMRSYFFLMSNTSTAAAAAPRTRGAA